MAALADLWLDYTVRTVVLGAAVLGVAAGVLGSLALLRRQSLLGDAMSHAALPGVVLAFLLTGGSKAPLVLMLGAAASGLLAALLLGGVVRSTRIKTDTAMALVLSVFFGLGLALLTYVQQTGHASQAGLDRYLFGQAATLMTSDVLAMSGVAGAALLLLALCWKELKLCSFDPDYAASLGLPVVALDLLLTAMLVIAIVVGLQAVGVVLMSAILVAPAAAARQWTDRLGVMVALAALFGAGSGVAGALISSSAEQLPTGPVIVLVAMALVGASLLFAPNRGLVSAAARRARSRRQLAREAVLLDLAELEAQHPGEERPHDVAALRAMRAGLLDPLPALRGLAEQGLVTANGGWRLTPAGRAEAARRRAAP